MLVRSILTALLVAHVAAEETIIGTAKLQRVGVTIVLDNSKSLEGQKQGMVEDVVKKVKDVVMANARERAMEQVGEMYVGKLPDSPKLNFDPSPEEVVEVTYKWANSKKQGMENSEGALGVSGGFNKFEGEGDLKKLLESCGGKKGGESAPEAPTRICVIVTDDKVMCDKDEPTSTPKNCWDNPDSTDPEQEAAVQVRRLTEDDDDENEDSGATPHGTPPPPECDTVQADVGDMDSCEAAAEKLKHQKIQVVLLSTITKYDEMRLRSSDWQGFLQPLCEDKCWNEVPKKKGKDKWMDIELTNACCSGYATGKTFSEVEMDFERVADDLLFADAEVTLGPPDGAEEGETRWGLVVAAVGGALVGLGACIYCQFMGRSESDPNAASDAGTLELPGRPSSGP